MLQKIIRIATGIIAAALFAAAPLVAAQAPVEVSFYFPVAVGGPITKIIDGFAADFEKENPGIKIKPIYSGTYQDTITKALTAVKGGEPPVTSILLSTDMFTLIDEDAIVPFDDYIKTADDQAWLKSFYPAFMENSQTGGKTWGIPFQRSTIVLYYNKEAFKEAGLDPNKPPANWKEMQEYAAKLTKRDASGRVTQWGVQIPSEGFPYWLFQGLAIEAGASLANAAGTETYYDKPEVIEALQYWVDLREEIQSAPGRHCRVGYYTEGFLRAESSDGVDDDGQPHEHADQRQVRLRRRDAAGGQAARQPDGRRQLLPLSRRARRRSATPRSGSSSGSRRRSARAMGHRHGLRRGARRCLGNAGDEAVRSGLPARRPFARDQLPFAKAELSTHDNQRVTQALERRPPGCAHRNQDAGTGDEGCAARGRSSAAAVQK
jgi:sn-glycerol 3-phosphate transport system substrate-binding protein